MSQQRFSDMSEPELDALIAGHIEHTAPGVATGAAHRCYERGKPEVYPKQMEQGAPLLERLTAIGILFDVSRMS